MLGIVFRSDDVKVEMHIVPSPGAYNPVGEKDSSPDEMLCAKRSAKAGPGGGGCTQEARPTVGEAGWAAGRCGAQARRVASPRVSEPRCGGRQSAFLRTL